MNRDRAAGYVLLAWMVMVGLISVRSVIANNGQPFPKNLPAPSVYLGSAVLYTMLWGATFFAPGLAVVLAFGTDIGALFQPYLQGKPGLADSFAAYLNKVAPQSSSAASNPTGGTTSGG